MKVDWNDSMKALAYAYNDGRGMSRDDDPPEYKAEVAEVRKKLHELMWGGSNDMFPLRPFLQALYEEIYAYTGEMPEHLDDCKQNARLGVALIVEYLCG